MLLLLSEISMCATLIDISTLVPRGILGSALLVKVSTLVSSSPIAGSTMGGRLLKLTSSLPAINSSATGTFAWVHHACLASSVA